MNSDRRTDEREHCVDGLAIHRVEVDRICQEAERDHRTRNVNDDGAADVGNRDAVADAGRTERLAGKQHVEEHFAVRIVRQGHCIDDRLQYGLAVYPADVVEDSACLQGAGEATQRRTTIGWFAEDFI